MRIKYICKRVRPNNVSFLQRFLTIKSSSGGYLLELKWNKYKHNNDTI